MYDSHFIDLDSFVSPQCDTCEPVLIDGRLYYLVCTDGHTALIPIRGD